LSKAHYPGNFLQFFKNWELGSLLEVFRMKEKGKKVSATADNCGMAERSVDDEWVARPGVRSGK
jgi:hypothetical protein